MTADLRDAPYPIKWPPPSFGELLTRMVLPQDETFVRVVSECVTAGLIETTKGYRLVECDLLNRSPLFGGLIDSTVLAAQSEST